jgi:hypothetical protein
MLVLGAVALAAVILGSVLHSSTNRANTIRAFSAVDSRRIPKSVIRELYAIQSDPHTQTLFVLAPDRSPLDRIRASLGSLVQRFLLTIS